MKKIIQSFLWKKQISFLDYFTLAYFFIVGVFLLLSIYEGIKFLIAQYTFTRAFWVFLASTFLYLGFVFMQTSWKENSSEKKTSKTWNIISVVSIHKNKEVLLYSGFLIFAVILLVGLILGTYGIASLATYVFFGIFILFKIAGWKIDLSVEKPSFSENTFLKILFTTLWIFFITLSYLGDVFGVQEHKNMILLVSSLFYIIGFTYTFSDIFSNIFSNITEYFYSRKFRSFLVKNTYNILSFSFIIVAGLLLLGKFWFFGGIDSQKLSLWEPETQVAQTPVPVSIEENAPAIIEPVYIERPISEIFTFLSGTQEGDRGEEVVKLQEALTLIGSFSTPVSGIYDETTKQALTNTLIEKCDWPSTTRGIFWPQAQACINSVIVQFEVTGPEAETGNIPTISDEAILWI